MRQNVLSLFLMLSGALSMLTGVSALPAEAVAVTSEPVVQSAPSPRPPIASTPQPADDDDDSSDDKPQPLGSITGTVIDQRTGAPAAGVVVNVGGQMLTTDANGNYEHALPAGQYGVVLMLSGDEGIASQGLRPVTLEPGARVVLHLAFHSPAPIAMPTAVPAAPVAPLLEPTVTAQLPVQALPATGVKSAEQAREQTPARLPSTSGYPAGSWLWLSLGALLLVSGAALRPRASGMLAAARQHLAAFASLSDHALLRRLVMTPTPDSSDDEVLAGLLHADVEEQ